MNSQYPKPIAPLTPLLGSQIPRQSDLPNTPSVLNIKNCRMTMSGRYAIALALEHVGLNADDLVLMPAYHCEAMVAPVKSAGLKLVFYRINSDTSINIEDIKSKLNPQVKIIIVTHYFGFLQDLSDIRILCNQHNIKLIEDCAHAFFGSRANHPVGTVGDYAIASSMKFLPLYEGGILCSESISLDNINLSSPGLFFQLKSIINIFEKSIEFHRLGFIGKLLNALFEFKSLTWSALKKFSTSPTSIATSPSSSEGGYGIDSEWVHTTISLPSKIIIKLSDLSGSAQLRRENYLKLDTIIAKLPNCRPLFTELSENIAPWVYPVYIDHPERYFNKLKMQGVPIWRFGEILDPEIDEKVCPISIEYRDHIFQFPCHQSLTSQEIKWMLDKISHTLMEN